MRMKSHHDFSSLLHSSIIPLRMDLSVGSSALGKIRGDICTSILQGSLFDSSSPSESDEGIHNLGWEWMMNHTSYVVHCSQSFYLLCNPQILIHHASSCPLFSFDIFLIYCFTPIPVSQVVRQDEPQQELDAPEEPLGLPSNSTSIRANIVDTFSCEGELRKKDNKDKVDREERNICIL
jgi:hypothetical protein